ncbi:hypothetical protein BEP19_09665 [Ammoniphilus oxalaticus]|uniref:Uncharacterized protein n=1 Tax=Ammoniphilus oxalaticus TaxID=66863 RepID=A0A419SKU9_9BACL|nr:hypothetical protein [Ammoniphilus oxalaticus]RKD24631.1 hypothetical protein BEP19_09665 [Ammoniphilus oxalaticus]
MENIKALHQMTSSALRFVQDVTNYTKKHGYILLHEQPKIQCRANEAEEKEAIRVTQSIYVAESDIELTVNGYFTETDDQEITVESTFDFLLDDSIAINQIHDFLKQIRDERTHHFYISIMGSQEEGFAEDEFSVVIRKKHRLGDEDDTFTQWDSFIQFIQQGQDDSSRFLPLDPPLSPKA